MEIDFNFDDLIDIVDLEPTPDPTPDPTPEPGPDPEPDPEPTEDDPIEDDPIEDGSGESDPIEGDYAAYFNFLKENNAIELEEGFQFDGTPESFATALAKSDELKSKKAKDAFMDSFSPELKDAIDFITTTGRSLEEYIALSQEIDYDSLDLEDVNTQRQLMYDYYKSTSNHPDERIVRMISNLERAGALAEEAESIIPDLKNNQQSNNRKQRLIDEANAVKQAAQERNKARAEQLTALVDSAEEWDSLRKNRLKHFMLNPVQDGEQYTTELAKVMGSIAETPEHLVQLADILADYHPKKGFNFERLKKKLKTESNLSFKSLMNTRLGTGSGAATPKKVKEGDFDWEGFLNY